MLDDNVLCPKCGARIPISKVLTESIRSDLERQLRASMDVELRRERARIEMEAAQKAAQKHQVELERLKRENRTQEENARKLALRLEAQRESMDTEVEKRLAPLRRQLKADAEKSAREDLERLRREAKTEADSARSLRAELQRVQRSVDATVKTQVRAERERIERDLEDRAARDLRNREKVMERQLTDARLQIRNLERKLETSSRQLEGDVAEGDLHYVLSRAYPDDEVRRISKRGGGADVHQRVVVSGKEVGSIVWESKNTAQWTNSWLPKLRQDQRRVQADVAVLVTAVRPRDCGKLEFRDGVWVTEPPLAVGLAAVLRSSLIQLSQYKNLPADSEKLAALQEYLGSTAFKHRIEAIVEAFQTMRSELSAEKQAAERHWAQREKQLHMLIENVSGMYGELSQVAGPKLARVRRLELPGT